MLTRLQNSATARTSESYLTGCPGVQVYRGIRGGVQDVAVKVLLCKDEDQLIAFEKVLLSDACFGDVLS